MLNDCGGLFEVWEEEDYTVKYEELSEKIIGAFYKVHKTLGYGFLESVYEGAMKLEFEKVGLKFENQVPIYVFYDGKVVGKFIPDFIIEEKIIVEIKANKEFGENDGKQLLNYLASTDKEVGLLLNFGIKPGIKRRVYDNELKGCKWDDSVKGGGERDKVTRTTRTGAEGHGFFGRGE